MVPSNPAAVHASLTALTLPWGLSWRNSFKKLVLPGVAVAVLGILGADFSLAAVLEFPRRLPVSFTLVLLTKVGLIVPSNPAACQASFTVFGCALGIGVEEVLHEAGLAWSNGCRPEHVGGCLFLGGYFGVSTQIAGQPQLLPHLADDGVTDRSFHPGSRPRLVHGFGFGLGIVVEKLLDEAGFALTARLLLSP